MIMSYDSVVTDDESTYSLSSQAHSERFTAGEQANVKDSDLGDYLDPALTLACQTKTGPQITTSNAAEKEEKDCPRCKTINSYCHLDLDSVLKLKESTKKLLCVIEEIQSKTHGKNVQFEGTNINLSEHIKLIPPDEQNFKVPSVAGIITNDALKKLEGHTKTLDSIYIQDEDDDCSVYKRLTRKCNCLNQQEYNDFVIHFNENTKYRTSVVGEIIKNMRIIKKFLYMNGSYTKNALLFLNEGLSNCPHAEKVEIVNGCAYADICNVLDDSPSLVTMYISWPCKNEIFGDITTQTLSAGLLYKLAQLEEGRRYLNYSSKITNDIKKVLRKNSSMLDIESLEYMNATLNLLNPPLTQQNINVTYYCKPVDEGIVKKTVNVLLDYRQHMTLNEIFAHLDILHSISNRDKGKYELTSYLPLLLILFKRILLEYDNSEINIIVTNILTNIVSKNMVKEPDLPKTILIADIATEPIQMRNEKSQHPPKKPNSRKLNKSKLGLGTSPNRNRNPSKRKVSDQEKSKPDWEPVRLLNHSRKFNKGNMRSSVIVVPVEK